MDPSTIAFSISKTDHADLVCLLDEHDGRHVCTDLWKALTARSASGEVHMTAARAEELLEWVRGRARAGRASSAAADLERALMFARVALALQRALAREAGRRQPPRVPTAASA
jgi:hypothetical protein